MSRKPASKKEKPAQALRKYELFATARWGGFININLDEETVAGFHSWRDVVGQDFWTEFDDVLGYGMKYSLSYDHGNNCYISTFTGALPNQPGDRYSMSARAGTFEESLALLVYKHTVIAQGDWTPWNKPQSTTRSFG